MKSIIHIKYDVGEMKIDLSEFFPTNQTRIKKLLNTIKNDYENRDCLISTIKYYLEESIEKYEIRNEELCKNLDKRLDKYQNKANGKKLLRKEFYRNQSIQKRLAKNLEYVGKFSC